MADMNDGSFTETYHGFSISGNREDPRGDYQRWYFHVRRNNKPVFMYSTKISGTQVSIVGGDTKADQLLRETGTRRVHGKIDLDRYSEGENEEFVITGDPPASSSLNDRDVRLFILQVLEKIRRLDPTRHKLESFDTRGFCEILGISHADYMSNAAYLRDTGYVADSELQQKTIENGGIYITTEGIDYLEQQQQKAKEDTVSADAEATRSRILGILHEYEETGDPHYLSSTAIAEQIGLSDRGARYHLDILWQEGYIRLVKTFSDWSAKIDTRGIQRVREGYRHTPIANVISGTSINISNSTVGMLNTGQIASVNSILVNISQLANNGQTEVAEALKHITEFVAQNQEMASEQREELLDLLTDLSEQATLQPEQRMKMSSLRAIINGVVTGLTVAGSSAEIWSTWGQAIMDFFGMA